MHHAGRSTRGLYTPDASRLDRFGNPFGPPAHGGKLVSCLAREDKRATLLRAAHTLARVTLNARQASDLEMIAVGAFSPLEGFMGQADYWSVLDRMRLANGLPWSLPITLAVDSVLTVELQIGRNLALEDKQGRLLGTMVLTEKYTYDKENEASVVYGTTDLRHPGVAALLNQGDALLAGPITLLERPGPRGFSEYRLDPLDTRKAFADHKWERVVGFQTRNPVHRAHEYLQKCALETVDGLLLHPLVGETKEDDIPAAVRMRCYQVLLEKYYPKDRVLLSVWPAAMRYAGPREAVFHALVRKNYGCTHFIVGRDHAGVGDYYDSFAAHQIFKEFSPEEIGIIPMFFDHAFFCSECGGMATVKTCPHGQQTRLTLSGTAVREMLQKGQAPPPEFTRPEIARILIDGMRENTEFSL